jgi:hypothetical protein
MGTRCTLLVRQFGAILNLPKCFTTLSLECFATLQLYRFSILIPKRFTVMNTECFRLAGPEGTLTELAFFHELGGNPKATIDVWWLVDDGGMR